MQLFNCIGFNLYLYHVQPKYQHFQVERGTAGGLQQELRSVKQVAGISLTPSGEESLSQTHWRYSIDIYAPLITVSSTATDSATNQTVDQLFIYSTDASVFVCEGVLQIQYYNFSSYSPNVFDNINSLRGTGGQLFCVVLDRFSFLLDQCANAFGSRL